MHSREPLAKKGVKKEVVGIDAFPAKNILTRRVDTSGKSGALFYYSEILQTPVALQLRGHFGAPQSNRLVFDLTHPCFWRASGQCRNTSQEVVHRLAWDLARQREQKTTNSYIIEIVI